MVEHLLIWRRPFPRGSTFLVLLAGRIIEKWLLREKLLTFHCLYPRREDSSIGFGAPVRTNMRVAGLTNAVVTSSLLESVRIKLWWLKCSKYLNIIFWILFISSSKSNLYPQFCLLVSLTAALEFQAETSDLIAYGLIPEFIGRFPILVSLSALNEDQLVQVC